jgi:aminopeptidase N
MIISFVKATGIARIGYDDYFYPNYCYDLPDDEARIFIQNRRAFISSHPDLVLDALIRLSYPSTKKYRSVYEIRRSIRISYDIDLSDDEILSYLSDLKEFFPIKEAHGLYSIDDKTDPQIRIDKVSL